jgi:hypothetical protein
MRSTIAILQGSGVQLSFVRRVGSLRIFPTRNGELRGIPDYGVAALFEAPTLVSGFDNVAVVREAIGQRGRHLGVAQIAIATLADASKDRPITGRHLFRNVRPFAYAPSSGPIGYSAYA